MATQVLLLLLLLLEPRSAVAESVVCFSNTTASDMLHSVNLTGKVFLITGGDGHIATQVNLALLRASATLVLACYNAEHCTAAAQSLIAATGVDPRRVSTQQVDLSSKASIRALAGNVSSLVGTGGLSGLINSAGSYRMGLTPDGFVELMEINTLGPALLTHLLLPLLRTTHGRIVNVAAAVFGISSSLAPPNNTVAHLTRVSRAVDPTLNATGKYFQLSKYLLIHHALEVARREPSVQAFAVNPGYAIEVKGVPQSALRHLDPHIGKACDTNFKGLVSCPETYAQAAAVVAVAAAHPALDAVTGHPAIDAVTGHPAIDAVTGHPAIDAVTGHYLDFRTRLLQPHDPQVFGPYEQHDPTCVPRPAPPMDAKLQSDWYDQMLKLMS